MDGIGNHRSRPKLSWATLFGFLALVWLGGCGRRAPSPLSSEKGVPVPTTPAAPQGAWSSGSGYGDVEGSKIQLRELVEGVTCEWHSGPAVYMAAQGFQRIHYVLAFVFDRQMNTLLEDEIIKLRVCVSRAPLKLVTENLYQSVVPYQIADIDHPERKPVQLAIRIENDIYLDGQAIAKLDETNLGYLLFHEAMHGLIPMTTPNRMTKLRDFVAGFRELEVQVPDPIGKLPLLAETQPEAREKYNALLTRFRSLKDSSRVQGGGEAEPDRSVSALVNHYLTLGDTISLRRLFAKGVSPNQLGTTGESLFLEMVRLVRECSPKDRTVICLNAKRIVSEYLDAGADPDASFDNHQFGWHPAPVWEYLLMSYGPHADTIDLELADLIFQKRISRFGRTAETQARLDKLLIYLSSDPHLGPAVEQAIGWGANVSAVDSDGRTPLLAAAAKGSGDGGWFVPAGAFVISILMRHGADVHARDRQGHGALDLLTKKRFLDFRGPEYEELYDMVVKLLTSGPSALPPSWEKLREMGWHE